MVDQLCDLAQSMARRLVDGGATLLAEPCLNQMLVSFGSDDETARVISAVQQDGACWVGGTNWKGQHAMRVSICDTATSEDDIAISAEVILDCWGTVRER